MGLNKQNENIDVSLLDEYQQSIFNGLKEIGEEISTLYYDGVKIFRSKFASKPYLLAHIAREIEGGIRDIFISDKKVEVQKCPQCGAPIKQSSHIDEICKVLGVDSNDEFVKEWHEIACQFHKYAHRHGPWKAPREKEAFDDLWKQFERKVLHRLVGSYLNLLTLVDRLLTYDSPTTEILETLDNLLQNEIRKRYFFKKLTSVQWFTPLLKRGYFKPQEAPTSQPANQEGYWTIPHWNVLDYLEKVSQQVTEPGNEEYIDELLHIIKDVTKYHIENDKCLDNYHIWWYFVKILVNLPTEKITDEILDLIPVWLDSKFDNMLPATEILEKLLPKFLDSNNPNDCQKAEKIVDFVTQVKWIPKYTEQQKEEIKKKYEHIFNKTDEERTEDEKLTIALLGLETVEPKTIVDTHWLIESFINQGNAKKIGEKCSGNIIFNLADKLQSIFKRKDSKYDFSYIWFNSLFDNPEFTSSCEVTLTLILREILSAKAKNNIEVTKEKIIPKLLTEWKYPLFKRLILFVIGNDWNNYKDIFWKMIEEDKEAELFNNPHFEAEVYTILQRYVSQFSSEEKEKIKNIIETKVPREPHTEEKYREFYSAYQRQKWYSALKEDDDFESLYKKYRDVTKEEEKISFKDLKIRVGPGPSPLTKEEILRMSNEELAKYLETFKTVDFWNGPTIGGLSDLLKDAVQENPEKFIDDLKPFLKTGYLYVYDILSGIRDAWEKKKIIDWEKLFNFIKEYITPKDFWDDKYKIEVDDWKANHLWVVGMIGELIRQGTIDDAWAFSEEHFQIAQEILFLIIDRLLKSEIVENQDITDYVTFALNSTFGKVTEALFMLALRVKRTDREYNHLVNELVNKYDILLNNKIIESYVWFGRYLPYFYYNLDKEWTKKKIETITIKNKELWEAFMEGYLFGNEVYEELKELYKLMSQNYEYAINYSFKDSYSTERLVHHISKGYLREIVNINDENSLFRKLLDKWEVSQVISIINYFWMQEKEYKKEKNQSIKNKEIAKIIDFWRWIFENKYKGKQENELTNDDKKILSELCKLTVFLPEINSENFEMVRMSARYVDVNYHSSFFIRYLNELKDKGQSVEFMGEIYLEMLENSTPDFRQEDIKSIVEFLYQKGKKEEADKICNIYGSRGYEFLRPIYDKYNKIE